MQTKADYNDKASQAEAALLAWEADKASGAPTLLKSEQKHQKCESKKKAACNTYQRAVATLHTAFESFQRHSFPELLSQLQSYENERLNLCKSSMDTFLQVSGAWV